MARKGGSPVGTTQHYNGIRLRVKGAGNLIPIMHSLDEVNSQTLVSMVMASTTAREPTRLANFKSQRMSLELKTTEIDETFRISKIVVFARASEGGEFPTGS